MRRSCVTWRLSFESAPSPEDLDDARRRLAPIADVRPADDAAQAYRDLGVSDYVFIEPEGELTAGELALHCLGKAHGLGRGWSVLWPGVPRNPQGTFAPEVWRGAALPEFLDGLQGAVSRAAGVAEIWLPKVVAASFEVKVMPEPARPRPVVSAASTRPATPPGTVVPLEEPLRQALLALLTRHLSTRWSWDAPAALLRQLLDLGLEPEEASLGEEAWLFKDRDGTKVQVRLDAGEVRAITFVLREQTDPHQLDERERTARQDEYEATFHGLAQAAGESLGPTAFVGAAGEDGFPHDQWAELAAVWPAASGRIMVQYKHDDRELPMQLCVVCAPTA